MLFRSGKSARPAWLNKALSVWKLQCYCSDCNVYSRIQELYFNEIVAYERKLDFATAKAKAQEYIQNYPSDEAGQKEWVFLSTR